MNLFEAAEQQEREKVRPLAARMRPRSLAEFTGQQHLLGEGCLLRRIIDSDRIGSVIFYGPPGTGKTSLAEVIAAHSERRFVKLNAASVGVREVREAIRTADNELAAAGRRTILFIDELHRFSRSQQDSLLPDVEDGTVSLIGATTANPYFSLVAPLISRSHIFQFQELNAEDVQGLLERAVRDAERGLGAAGVTVDTDALERLAVLSDGDARRALTALEIAVLSVRDSTRQVSQAVVTESMQARVLRYDPDGDDHYDVASALIKSIRGSDPDAALYWLARMLESGEDPRFVARRLVISASEDIGNADPQALPLAMAGFQATEVIGMPECRINLAQVTTYLACAQKSNASHKAVDAAIHDLKNEAVQPVPVHLRDAHYQGAKELGHGADYQYPHNTEEGWSNQQYLMIPKEYYHPVNRGAEAVFAERLRDYRRRRANAERPENH